MLKPSPVNEVQFEQNEYQPFRSQSTSFSGYDRSYVSSHPNEYFESFRPPVSEFSNRVNYSFNEQYDLTKRNKSLIKLINRDNDIYTPMQTPVYARNVVRQNIYSEPAPQQPVHLTKLNQQTPIIKALNEYKYYILIGFVLLFLISYFLISSVPENPIENI